MDFLIEKGIDIHIKDMYQRTALHPACNRGHYEIVQTLIEQGAQVRCERTFHTSTCFKNLAHLKSLIFNGKYVREVTDHINILSHAGGVGSPTNAGPGILWSVQRWA